MPASGFGEDAPQQQEEEEAGDGERDRHAPARPARAGGRCAGAREVELGALPGARKERLAQAREVVIRRREPLGAGEQADPFAPRLPWPDEEEEVAAPPLKLPADVAVLVA